MCPIGIWKCDYFAAICVNSADAAITRSEWKYFWSPEKWSTFKRWPIHHSNQYQFVDHFELLNKNKGNSTLSIVNKIYVQRDHQLNKNFEEVEVEKFKSGIESLDFAKSSESAQTINHFVEEKTNGKIKPDALRSDTRLILVNAIYFKGGWEHPFKEQYTPAKGISTSVKMRPFRLISCLLLKNSIFQAP